MTLTQTASPCPWTAEKMSPLLNRSSSLMNQAKPFPPEKQMVKSKRGQRHVSVLPFLSFPARFRPNGFL
jgi:hypothetical protein